MRVSIAMATYNGAKYIHAQLGSFATQARLPDELIVCDDRSSDETVRILENFSQTAPFKVRIVCNSENLGYARNFEKAISLCSGDLIFLSDQDDVWFTNKIEIIEAIFEKSPSLLAAINDVEITDHNLVTTGETLLEGMKKTGRFTNGARYHVLGCATAFRANLRRILLPLPSMPYAGSDVVAHDVWINVFSHSCKARVVVDKPLQFYRRHTETVTSFDTASSLQQLRRSVTSSSDPRPVFSQSEKVLAEVENRLAKLETNDCKELCGSASVSDFIRALSKERTALKNRIALQDTDRFSRIFKAVKMWITGDYDFFLGWKSLAKDLMRH